MGLGSLLFLASVFSIARGLERPLSFQERCHGESSGRAVVVFLAECGQDGHEAVPLRLALGIGQVAVDVVFDQGFHGIKR